MFWLRNKKIIFLVHTLNLRPAYFWISFQDFTVFGGSLSGAHARKICKVRQNKKKSVFNPLATGYILHALLSSADFFKINYFKNFFLEYHLNVKQF